MSSPSRFPAAELPHQYWEQRARRFAAEGAGLRAVCSYGMPGFYNQSIDLCQRLALRRWLQVPAGSKVLDLGCGVGRWSRRMAARGARVQGVDLSPTMVREAQRRTAAAGLSARCSFSVGDLAELPLQGSFDLILGVTVLQHILDPARLQTTCERLAARLTPEGRLVLLEAAPSLEDERCDTPIFRARSQADYQRLLREAGLEIEAVTGVDPMPLKTWLLPVYRDLPVPLGLTLLALATALSIPVDALLGRQLVRASWHKVFICRRSAAGT